MNKLFGAAGALGAGALTKKFLDRRESRKHGDEEYQSVATDTPGRNRLKRPARSEYTESEFSDEMTDLNSRVRGKPILPGPGNPTAMAAAMSAAERPERPITPRPSHARPGDSRLESTLDSDYSSYVSPSRRAREERDTGGNAGKGLLAGLGLGWFAKKLADRKDRKADADRLRYEEERRDGHHGSRYTGDGYGSPTRKPSRRYTAPAGTATTMTGDSDFSSVIDTRPTGAGHGGPPMPPLGAAGAAAAARHSRSHSRDPHGPVDMPPIPPDPHGLLHRDESVINDGQPVSVKVKYHDDRDRNVTLRRLTEEEAAREHRRRRSNSISSVSGGESSSRRRYRRDSSANRTVTDLHGGRPMGGDPLSPPTPAFAGGRRPAKDSAYYSEPDHPPPPPPTGPHLTTPMRNNQTVSQYRQSRNMERNESIAWRTRRFHYYISGGQA
ncbi:hypothetical protein PG987_008979 [Apiospora arundinis]